jgi:hypothetical protein
VEKRCIANAGWLLLSINRLLLPSSNNCCGWQTPTEIGLPVMKGSSIQIANDEARRVRKPDRQAEQQARSCKTTTNTPHKTQFGPLIWEKQYQAFAGWRRLDQVGWYPARIQTCESGCELAGFHYG